jgi:hypothetical protein
MKSSILKSDKLKALTMVLIVLGVVFFVIFSVYKNLDNLSMIRSITDFNRAKALSPSREGFVNHNYLGYSSYPDNLPIDTKIPMLIDQDKKPPLGRVWGFSGVYGAVGVADNSIDVFYGAKSDMTCDGSELSKGSGNLCLDKNQRKLLTSRGGNANTDSVIG